MVTNELLKRKYWQVLIIGAIIGLFVVYFVFSQKTTNYKEGAKLVYIEKHIKLCPVDNLLNIAEI